MAGNRRSTLLLVAVAGVVSVVVAGMTATTDRAEVSLMAGDVPSSGLAATGFDQASPVWARSQQPGLNLSEPGALLALVDGVPTLPTGRQSWLVEPPVAGEPSAVAVPLPSLALGLPKSTSTTSDPEPTATTELEAAHSTTTQLEAAQSTTAQPATVQAATAEPTTAQSATVQSTKVQSNTGEPASAQAEPPPKPAITASPVPTSQPKTTTIPVAEPPTTQRTTTASPAQVEPPPKPTTTTPAPVKQPRSVPVPTNRPTVTTTPTTRPTTVRPATTRPTATTTPTTRPTTTRPPTTTVPKVIGQRPASAFEPMRNHNPLFDRYSSLPASQINLGLPGLLTSTDKADNGSVGDGQFRVACEYSHFASDDPIVHPGKPGGSHLHMFFGNTETNANSTTDSLVNSGGGSCNGFELNRSGYWTPALLDGRGNAVVPDRIILYYKTKWPHRIEAMPQGLKMVVGNTSAESFQTSHHLFWSCGSSGSIRNRGNRIVACGNDQLNATIAFPQCWDGRLDSHDHRSHLKLIDETQPCPASHPRRLPQISILLYFPGASSIDGWHLSSDRLGGFNATPGGTLHADWWGGWNDDAMQLWTDGCMKRARNCSFGQTGGSRRLAALNGLETYDGENYLPLPS